MYITVFYKIPPPTIKGSLKYHLIVIIYHIANKSIGLMVTSIDIQVSVHMI